MSLRLPPAGWSVTSTARARLARQGWPLTAQEMHICCADGRRRVAVDTVSAIDGERPLFLHLMRDAPKPPAADKEPPPEPTAP